MKDYRSVLLGKIRKIVNPSRWLPRINRIYDRNSLFVEKT